VAKVLRGRLPRERVEETFADRHPPPRKATTRNPAGTSLQVVGVPDVEVGDAKAAALPATPEVLRGQPFEENDVEGYQHDGEPSRG
jgi:hypothetical protein